MIRRSILPVFTLIIFGLTSCLHLPMETVRGIRGECRVHFESPGKSITFPASFAISPKGEIRFEFKEITGLTVWILCFKDSKLDLYDLIQHRRFHLNDLGFVSEKIFSIELDQEFISSLITDVVEPGQCRVTSYSNPGKQDHTMRQEWVNGSAYPKTTAELNNGSMLLEIFWQHRTRDSFELPELPDRLKQLPIKAWESLDLGI